MAFARVQNFHLNQIEAESDASNDKHVSAYDLRWHEESFRSLNEEPNCHDPDSSYRDEGTDNFGTIPTISEMVASSPLTEA